MSNSRKLDHRNHGKQTDSHNIQQLSTSNEKLSTSEENLTTFIESWKNYDRAGSLLVSSICKDLSDNQSDDLESILGSSITGTLFSGSVSEQALGHLKELENLMTTPKQSDRKPKCDLSKVCFFSLFPQFQQFLPSSSFSLWWIPLVEFSVIFDRHYIIKSMQ